MATIATKASEPVAFRGPGGNITLDRETNPEGASQTFLKGNFLVDSSGNLIIIAADNNGDAIGIATKAGANVAAAAAQSEYVPMSPLLKLEMNLLEATDAAHVLAVGDLWTYVQWQTTSSHHVLDTTSTTDRFFVVKIGLGAVGDAYGRGGVGDSNCRVFATPLGSMCANQFDV